MILAGVLLARPAALPYAGQEQGGTIRVQVHYTGKGAVNQSHRIFVALWNSPAFAEPDPKGKPAAVKDVVSKDGIVSFSHVKESPLYVSCAYDPAGRWDGRAAPPNDVSIGIYGNAALQPQPVHATPGALTNIEITFDDSVKWK
jgi:hypothetical protein